MRILYHHRTRATDAQRIHILEIVRALRGLGHTVEIASLVDTEAPERAPDADVEESPLKAFARRIPFFAEALQLGYNVFAIPWLVWRVIRLRPGFIYERHSLFNFAGGVVSILTGLPLILEVNSPFALEQGRDGEIRATALAHWCERLQFRMASHIIVVSGPLARILEADGVPPAKLVRMPNGVDLKAFDTAHDAAAIRTGLGLGNRIVIGFVGWFRPWHGLEMLIDAFAHARLGERRAALLLIGDGPAMPALRAQVNRLGLDADVVFSGAVPHERIPQLLSTVDIAAQPAANEYCCPMKVIEYMGMAKPIVAPAQPNIAELVADDREALLFRPGDMTSLADAMSRLVDDSILRQRLGAAGRHAIDARGHSWAANAARVVTLGGHA